MKIGNRILTYIAGRYTKVQILVLCIVIFFGFLVGDSSVFSRMSYSSKISNLKSEIKFYQEKSAEDKQKLEEIHEDKERVEKFARENYKMKKSDEDIFIIE